MLDALVDRQDRDVTGACQAPGVQHRLQRGQDARRSVRQPVRAIHVVGTWQQEAVLRNRLALVLEETQCRLQEWMQCP